jgi:metal-sulfur cluster biosynthetic enzyme
MTPALDEIYARLNNVYDPELDESIVQLGFVEAVQIDGGQVTVIYKLPTFWCAANFAYMMSADVRAELGQIAGVTGVRVLLRDHFADEQLNDGVNAGRSFCETFPGEALDDLDELRQKFLHRSFMARQEQLIRRLRNAGLNDAQIVALRVVDLQPAGEDALVQPGGDAAPIRVRLAAADRAKYLRTRVALGLPASESALLFTTLDNAGLEVAELNAYLRHTRIARLNIAFNTSVCEGLLHARRHPDVPAPTSTIGDGLLAV